ncbi:MAG: hypothetical protein WCP69_06340 [Bacteroidota bacterium]
MKKILLMIIVLTNSFVFSQDIKDTLFFHSAFDFWVKRIEISDTCSGGKIVLNPHDGKHISPKTMIVNQETKVFKVIIYYRFLSKKIGYLQLSDIKTKYIYIYKKDKNVQFVFPRKIKGRL